MRLLLLFFLLTLVPAAQANDGTVSATILWFLEQEPGIDPYRVRYIVTKNFLRSDEGSDDVDFLLFDRQKNIIHSVVSEDRSVLQINGHGDVAIAPPELKVQIKKNIDAKAPKVGGQVPVTLELLAGDSLCQSAMVAPGFIEHARKAFQEFSRAVAVQQARTLNNTPPELRTPCFLAHYLHTSDFHLAEGMPLAEWSPDGKRRELVGVDEHVAVPVALFVIPDDYTVLHASKP